MILVGNDIIPVVNPRRAEWPLPKARRSEAGVHDGGKNDDTIILTISGRGHGFTVIDKYPSDGLSENTGSQGLPAERSERTAPLRGTISVRPRAGDHVR